MRERLLAELPGATALALAPGRVNLIGEHTDYNGFGVLPLAIDRHVGGAVAARDGDELVVRNVEAARYPGETIPLPTIAERAPRGTWVDYVVAALRAYPPARGLEIVVGGDLPAAAGLSSSSALVVATMLALREPDDRQDLAERARLAEQYVGTQSGGMDQAIALLAQPGHALAIDFRPLRAEPIALPDDLAVLVADSGVRAAKGGAAMQAYNDRVAACCRAAELLGAPEGGLLADVPAERRDPTTLLDDMLRRRARFVFEEARRRDRAIEALRAGDLAALGALLDDSHRGLRDDYEVSTPEVDALVEELRAAGALGARIVGAGFGGCAIAVAERSRAAAIVAATNGRAQLFDAAGPARREDL